MMALNNVLEHRHRDCKSCRFRNWATKVICVQLRTSNAIFVVTTIANVSDFAMDGEICRRKIGYCTYFIDNQTHKQLSKNRLCYTLCARKIRQRATTRT